MSSNPSPSPPVDTDEGFGCRPFLVAVASLIVFAVASVWLGLWMALGDDPSFAGERIGLALYVAGAPVSGGFSALTGELPLAPLTDVIVWLVAGGLIARRANRHSLRHQLLITIAGALVFGALVSQAIERA